MRITLVKAHTTGIAMPKASTSPGEMKLKGIGDHPGVSDAVVIVMVYDKLELM
jgi:hypothetical protein